jgi:hypothetical protein
MLPSINKMGGHVSPRILGLTELFIRGPNVLYLKGR